MSESLSLYTSDIDITQQPWPILNTWEVILVMISHSYNGPSNSVSSNWLDNFWVRINTASY